MGRKARAKIAAADRERQIGRMVRSLATNRQLLQLAERERRANTWWRRTWRWLTR